ncbi:M1 family metallopeptidase [Pedobacter sp. N36a]|uniref:M1 family metallopeptidase n=1 Tax=Pedobacter sp. N36a TaxID=2767996 RepID=UPI001656FC1C|nr:M1 family metallopeptidase [Pedobacter sp. N36a]MBC8986568.1 M1 family metallopeptidase [Pedobacter sp. N36a]
MMIKRISFFILSFGWSVVVSAQQSLPLPPEIQTAYTNGTRDVSGKPGPKYWQNTANYDLKVNFNPETRALKGVVEVVYYNNSPDTLKQLWFKLYPNLYKKGVERNTKFNNRDLNDGVDILAIQADGHQLDKKTITIDGTNMQTSIAPLAPGKSIKLKISYQYDLNKGSHMRTGQVDEGSHFVAYFFPRIAVYDDVDGWNKYPYTGDVEFYNDFCNFKGEITVPKNFVVWATGDLMNSKQVLRKEIAARLAKAEKEDAVIDVINDQDLANKAVTADQAYNTWKFDAKNVTDFVFATSDHYLWKSTSLVVDPKTGRRTRVDAAFNPIHKDYYEVIDFARQTVHAMSYTFPKWPFPYAHETIFDGLDQMEYPMMVNDNPVEKRQDAITLTVHEIFHTMFPFYMGINETKYAWMDEGWATIGEWLIGPMIDTTMVDEYGIAPTGMTSGTKDDSPIVTLTTELKGSGTFTNSYPKPGLGYLFVKDYLGDELFLKALHHYIKLWNGKHPMPYDFFNSMNEGSGKDLNWFWKRWFFEEGVTDLAIARADKVADGYEITIKNKSNKPLPIDLKFTYGDDTTEDLHKSIGVWEKGDAQVTIKLKTGKKLKKVELGSAHVPDKDKSDNMLSL